MNRVVLSGSVLLLFAAGVTSCKKSSGDAPRNLDKLRITSIATIKVTEGINGFPNELAPGFCKNNITAYTTGIVSYSGVHTDKEKQSYILTYTKEGLPETSKLPVQMDTYTFKYTYEEF